MTPEQQKEYNRLNEMAKNYKDDAKFHEELADEARENWENCLEEAEGFKEKCDEEDKS